MISVDDLWTALTRGLCCACGAWLLLLTALGVAACMLSSMISRDLGE